MRARRVTGTLFFALFLTGFTIVGSPISAHGLPLSLYIDEINKVRDKIDSIEQKIDKIAGLLQQVLNNPKISNAAKQRAKDKAEASLTFLKERKQELLDRESLIDAAYTVEASGHGNLIGSDYCDNTSPLCQFPVGDTVMLSYEYLDPRTGLSAIGPAISSVTYAVNFDPSQPNNFVFIGTSSDAGTDFSLPFTIDGEDLLIRATPYDSQGQPIFIDGVEDENSAPAYVVNIASVPEPTSLILLGVGLAGLVARIKVFEK